MGYLGRWLLMLCAAWVFCGPDASARASDAASPSAGQAAAVWHVDDDNQSGAYDGTARYPYASIQAAVTAASSGDVVRIAVGSYGPVQTQGKGLTFLGGYPGASPAAYAAGTGGDFSQRTLNPALTVVSGGAQSVGVTFTRFSDSPYQGGLDNLTVRQSRKGVVCDTDASWPHPDNLAFSSIIVEDNGGIAGDESWGAGMLVCGGNTTISDSIVRNNRGGWGAGVLRRDGDGTLHMENTRIEDNACLIASCHGAGVSLFSGPNTLVGNLIAGNRIEYDYGWGGGLFITGPGVTHTSGTIFRDNYAPSYGAAVFVDGSTAVMTNDLVWGNQGGARGGAGIAADREATSLSQVHLDNCTVAGNVSQGLADGGNGIFLDVGSSAAVVDSVFWGNGDDFFVNVPGGSALAMTYSLSQEAWPGTGNLASDPFFADPGGGDFHLQSVMGRYQPATGLWVRDARHSPAIDAGNPASPFSLEPTPNGSRVNMGAFGDTAQASKGRAGFLPGILLPLFGEP